VLYLTWARQNAPETQDALNTATYAIAEEIGARVVPVGLAWQAAIKRRALQKDKTHELYDKDGSHPSQAGSYLAACVFVATLLDQSPVGLIVPDALQMQIDEMRAGLLQGATRDALSAGGS
jgi:hypothetical protein